MTSMTVRHINLGVGSRHHKTGGLCNSLPLPRPGRTPVRVAPAFVRAIRGREPSTNMEMPVDHLLVTVGNSSHLHPTHMHLHNRLSYF